MPEEIQKLMDFKLVETMDEVLGLALVGGPKGQTAGDALPGAGKPAEGEGPPVTH